MFFDLQVTIVFTAHHFSHILLGYSLIPKWTKFTFYTHNSTHDSPYWQSEERKTGLKYLHSPPPSLDGQEESRWFRTSAPLCFFGTFKATEIVLQPSADYPASEVCREPLWCQACSLMSPLSQTGVRRPITSNQLNLARTDTSADGHVSWTISGNWTHLSSTRAPFW